RAGILVDGEDADAVAVLVGDKAELAARVEGKIPRRLDAFSLVAGRSQLATLWIHPEHGDAVVPAIRAVQKLARWVRHHFRRVAGAGEVLGKRRECLNFGQRSLVGVVAEGSDGVVQFVDDIREFAAGMKREMPRPRAGRDGRGVWVVPRQRAVFTI